MEIREVGVIGLGTMGAGIAEVFARGGLPVIAVEADDGALARGMAAVRGSLGRALSRGRLAEDESGRILGRIRPATAIEEAATADLVVEAVPERLPLKQQVVAELGRCCRPDAILATNTSSLPVTAIAAGSARPGRVVGMHFFNPAPTMRLVEVVTTVLSDPAAAQAVADLARRLGKTPVLVGDRAGFVANALLLPYLNHAVRLLEAGYAGREDIDAAATAGLGLPMGPLALLDLIGLDTALAILEVLRRELGEARHVPAPLLRRMAEAGRVGRKSGAGFYEYPPPERGDRPPGPPGVPAGPPPRTVTVIGPGEQAAASERTARLAGFIAAAGCAVTRDPGEPSDLAVIAIGPEGGVLGPARAAGRAADAVGLHLIGPEPGRADLAELVPSPLTAPEAAGAARSLAARLGIRAVRSPDRPGLLAGALLAPHLRDAVAMIADGYASPADVDAAMTLGCGYPRGPVRMLADAGPAAVIGVLRAMHAAYGDPAFAPPPLLIEWALAGVPPAPRPAG